MAASSLVSVADRQGRPVITREFWQRFFFFLLPMGGAVERRYAAATILGPALVRESIRRNCNAAPVMLPCAIIIRAKTMHATGPFPNPEPPSLSGVSIKGEGKKP